MQQNHIPYCYYISWSKENKHYYGVKYGRDANPSTFWTKYFTSSRYVESMREKCGEPDIIEVRKTFNTADEAVLWEEKVIRRLGIVRDTKWLNRNNTSTGTKGIINVPKTEAQKEHQRQQILGKKHTQETKNKIAEGLRNYKRTEKHQQNINNSLKGIKKPSLMTGEYKPCIICDKPIYQTRYMLNKGYIRKTCSKACKAELTRLNYLKRFNRI